MPRPHPFEHVYSYSDVFPLYSIYRLFDKLRLFSQIGIVFYLSFREWVVDIPLRTMGIIRLAVRFR